MYLNNLENDAELSSTIGQYIQLTGYEAYELVGDFKKEQQAITSGVAKFMQLNGKKMSAASCPAIIFHGSLDNLTMRHMVAQSQRLVVTTGVMSTVEAMQDGKLPFYQTMRSNQNFVASYLMAIKLMCTCDTTLFGQLPSMIIRMSALLFAPKPLSLESQSELKWLLAIDSVSSHLVEINQKIIKKENGRIAGQLLGFISGPKNSNIHNQCVVACLSLLKPGETAMPLFDAALKRAACWGRLFELKVLLRNMSPEEASRPDSKRSFSALHWAVFEKQFDCARVLIKHGVNLDAQDRDGKTPLHYAVLSKNREMIRLLVSAGASPSIEDKRHETPCNAVDESLLEFIQACSYRVGVMV